MNEKRFCGMLRPLGIAAALCASTVLNPGPSIAADGVRYCRVFNPSISYLQVPLPKLLQPIVIPGPLDGMKDNSPLMALAKANAGPSVHFSSAAIKYATISSFVEQLALAVASGDDPFLNSLRITPMDKSVRDAMGFGAAGTRLVEPGEGIDSYSDVKLELVDSDETGAYSDSLRKITIERGLVDRIVSNAINNNFGGVDGYKAHLAEILAMTDSPNGLSVENSQTDVAQFAHYDVKDGDVTAFPIGQVIENAYSAPQGSPFRNLRQFAQEVVGQLVFIGAHEAGHIRNGHRTAKTLSCEQFKEHERQADAYAAGILADFQFNMTPDGSGNPPLTHWEDFFQYYKDIGLTTEDTTTGCQYESPAARMAWVQEGYQLAWDDLMKMTYSSVDYGTPNPTSSICTDGARTWRQSVE